MDSSKRNILVFQSKESNADFYQELTKCQWQVYVADSTDEAFDKVTKIHFYVGLCLVDECNNESYWEQITHLFNHTPKINWLLGLPKECMFESSIYSKKSRLIAQYCYDYLILPIDLQRLLFSLGHAYGMAELSNSPYREIADFPNFGGIIGNSPIMRKLFKQIEKVCKEDLSVLIEGETGTGKELIAQAIHARSGRAHKPFVAINCGAFPPDLIQAELFGFEKGAFTGAHARKLGRIEIAQGGTLFLDEIGELPLSQQVNLLRFIEERVIERIGGTEKIPIDVRIISATHVDLKEAVKSGKFREDLYYRLKVLQLKTPPLRERDGDIELLSWYFFNQAANESKHKTKGFNVEALYVIQHYEWPGNIRELMNGIRHAVVMSENRLLTPADLGLERRLKERNVKTLEEARAEADRESILSSIHNAQYNMSRAAQNLGISRVSLYRLIDKYQLKV
ncbi:MAG: sigma 54-interacting transcriptional regulator [Gammaproteobacteria bacterium]